MRSVQSVAVDKVLEGARDVRKEAVGTKADRFLVIDKFKENLKTYHMPFNIWRKLKPETEKLFGTKTYFIKNKKFKGNEKPQKCVFYLHGGSYVDQPMVFHWNFITKIVADLDIEVCLPIYNKTPTSTCTEVVPQMVEIYKHLLNSYTAENITVMGDSAGGGLSLALTEYLVENNLPLPKQLILFSPWVDVTMQNPEIKNYEADDIMLHPKTLRLWGACYNGKNEKGFYLSCPINNIKKEMPKTHIFVGSKECFLPECLRFKHKADEVGADVKLFEYAFMQHVFPLMPLPEAIEVRKYIYTLINS